MDAKRRVTVSKYLSKHLRHTPERLGLTLTPGGWVEVESLLAACAAEGFPVSEEELGEVVATSDKQRFAFDPSGLLVRANQGHSTPVDLQLEAVTPPDVLYHGTPAERVDVILTEGLKKMARHHVHLSATVESARTVGARRGRPVVLVVSAGAMSRAGLTFYRSANGVWLTDSVPPQFLRVL
jgi:putative RNA 2'-phosphotransferase